MSRGLACMAVLGAFSLSLVSLEASAEQEKVVVFDIPDGVGLDAQEVETLLSVVTTGLEELPRTDFSIEAVERTTLGVDEACDDKCLLDSAKEDGAAYVVAGDLKRIKKKQMVLTITLTSTEDGQVLHSSVSDVCVDLNALMAAARVATDAMKEQLLSRVPEPEPEPPAPVEPVNVPDPSIPLPGILRINSAPPGAQVILKTSKKDQGRVVGAAPLELSLKPWTYWVNMTMDGYLDYEERTTVGVGQTVERNIVLEVDKWPPLRVAAHATLWPGLAVGLLGGAAGYMSWKWGNEYDEELDQGVADKSRQWAVVMYAAGGLSAALVTTSIVCFVLRNKEKKRAARSHQAAVGAVPSPDGEGAVFSLRGRF